MSHLLPARALESHIAILGKTGSGKTITAKLIAESLLDDGKRFCAVDPTGVWWGLKSTKTGKKAGYPIVIFGGDHADFPLAKNQGAAVADIVASSDFSTVIDTSAMTIGERTQFFTDFAENLLRKNRLPLHLFLDEAHNFAPQGNVPSPQAGMMLHATNNLASMGRSRGIRMTMISQRPAKLHKDTLTQAETLIAMRLIAPQDRKAIEDWIADYADKKQGADIVASLSRLPTGEGWVWSPEADVLERRKFPMIKTYDSSKAPTGDAHEVILAKIDLEGIGAKLATVAAEVLAEDPATLKKMITQLAREVHELKTNPMIDVTAVEKARQDGIKQGHEAGWEGAMLVVREFTLGHANKNLSKPAPAMTATQVLQLQKREKTPEKINMGPIVTVSVTGQAGPVSGGEKKILSVLAQNPNGCSREQLTIMTGYKKSSRDTYVQRLKARGLAVGSSDDLRATAAGIEALGDDYEPLPTGEALRDYWLAKLPKGERDILAVLFEHYPSAVDRQYISDTTDYKKSSRDTYLQRLVSRKLVRKDGSSVAAVEGLFA